jgi:hypothetical protein
MTILMTLIMVFHVKRDFSLAHISAEMKLVYHKSRFGIYGTHLSEPKIPKVHLMIIRLIQ